MACSMRAMSPPGSTIASLPESSQRMKEQFCSNAVTGRMAYFMFNGLRLESLFKHLIANTATRVGLVEHHRFDARQQEGQLTIVVDVILLVLQVLAQIVERRSEEHTSELQSRENLVCRLLLEKKK